MKIRLLACLLCAVLLFVSFSAAGEAPEVPDGWEPVDIADLVIPELRELEPDDDRAPGFFAPAEDAPDTGDQVIIQKDGSFEIVSGMLRLSCPQPMGFIYYTQSYEAQQDLYSKYPDTLAILVSYGVHVYFDNTADNVKAFLTMEDKLNLLPLMNDSATLEQAMETVAYYQRAKYKMQVRQATFNGTPYLVVTDPDEGYSYYQTVIGSIPVTIEVYYYSGFTDTFEQFLEYWVLGNLSLSLVNS